MQTGESGGQLGNAVRSQSGDALDNPVDSSSTAAAVSDTLPVVLKDRLLTDSVFPSNW